MHFNSVLYNICSARLFDGYKYSRFECMGINVCAAVNTHRQTHRHTLTPRSDTEMCCVLVFYVDVCVLTVAIACDCIFVRCDALV